MSAVSDVSSVTDVSFTKVAMNVWFKREPHFQGSFRMTMRMYYLYLQ